MSKFLLLELFLCFQVTSSHRPELVSVLHNDLEIEAEASASGSLGSAAHDVAAADPLVAKMGGKWTVEQDGTPPPASFEVSCDGKAFVTPPKAPKGEESKTKIEIDKAKELCTKGSHKKQEFYANLPAQAPPNSKVWICGWYDEKTDSWSAYMYTDFKKVVGKLEHGHKKEDRYLGMFQGKRVKKGDCPIPKSEESEERSNAMAAAASLLVILVWNVMAFL